jgi:hypothetical protein
VKRYEQRKHQIITCVIKFRKNARNNREINGLIAVFSRGVNDLRAMILFIFQMNSFSNEKASELFVIYEVNMIEIS